MSTAKTCKDSLVTMTELVLPNETNSLNNLMGGELLKWMDIVSAISAQRHSSSTVVTVSVDNVSFNEPINLGNVVTLNAKVTRAFNSSMEVHIEVFSENIPKQEKHKSNEAFFTFVAVNENNKPKKIPEIIPETDEEKRLYDNALKRRQARLILAGRLEPNNAEELKALFVK